MQEHPKIRRGNAQYLTHLGAFLTLHLAEREGVRLPLGQRIEAALQDAIKVVRLELRRWVFACRYNNPDAVLC